MINITETIITYSFLKILNILLIVYYRDKNISRVIIYFRLEITMKFFRVSQTLRLIALKFALFSGKQMWVKIYFGTPIAATSSIKTAPREEISSPKAGPGSHFCLFFFFLALFNTPS